MIKLTQLFIHPIKSMRGLERPHAQITKSGLADDRVFMLTTKKKHFISARQYPSLVCFTPTLINGGIEITAPDG